MTSSSHSAQNIFTLAHLPSYFHKATTIAAFTLTNTPVTLPCGRSSYNKDSGNTSDNGQKQGWSGYNKSDSGDDDSARTTNQNHPGYNYSGNDDNDKTKDEGRSGYN